MNAHLDGHLDEHLDVEFIMVVVLAFPSKKAFKHWDEHLDVHPDVHLDMQFIMVIVLGLFLITMVVTNAFSLHEVERGPCRPLPRRHSHPNRTSYSGSPSMLSAPPEHLCPRYAIYVLVLQHRWPLLQESIRPLPRKLRRKKKKLWKGVPGASRPRGQKNFEKGSKMTIFQVIFRVFGSFSTLFRLFLSFFNPGAERPREPFFRLFSEFSRQRPFWLL